MPIADNEVALKNLTSVLCDDPGTDNSSFLIGLQTFLLVIVVVAFALRMVCRALRIAPWGHDDSTIVVAFVSKPFQVSPIAIANVHY